MKRPSLVALLAASGFLLACNSNDSVPPPIIPDVTSCNPPTCTVVPPSAAIAFEVDPNVDGGACPAALEPTSLPRGDAAFDAITACGGNVGCGARNYRVATGGADTEVSCSVVGTGPVQITGHASAGGIRFDVSGNIDETGGAVTVNAIAGDAGAFGGACTATTHVILKSTIYADFTCPNTGTPDCRPQGTFVFENCGTE